MTKLLEWDGSLENLPPSGLFLYKDVKCNLSICPCGCDNPTVTYAETDKTHFEATVRMRGKKQGNPMATVLVKLGKMEQLILTNGDGDAVGTLLNDVIGEINQIVGYDHQKVIEYMSARGVSSVEMLVASMEALGIPFELVQFMML